MRRCVGLEQYVPRGNVAAGAIIFWSFRIMVGLGFLMLGLGCLSLLLARWGGSLY